MKKTQVFLYNNRYSVASLMAHLHQTNRTDPIRFEGLTRHLRMRTHHCERNMTQYFEHSDRFVSDQFVTKKLKSFYFFVTNSSRMMEQPIKTCKIVNRFLLLKSTACCFILTIINYSKLHCSYRQNNQIQNIMFTTRTKLSISHLILVLYY